MPTCTRTPPTLPSAISPMLAQLAHEPFDSPKHIFEVKWDGIRALAYIQSGRLRLQSLTGRDITSQFPELAGMPRQLEVDGVVLDGELVCFDEQGQPSLRHAQQRLLTTKRRLGPAPPTHYIAFDLLYHKGASVMGEPLTNRKELLRRVLNPGDLLQECEYIDTDGIAFFQATCDIGLEGVVAKEKSGVYVPGKSSPSWLQVKQVHHYDFVVGGYTARSKQRPSISSLLLGLYDEEKRLVYVGTVGTGFSHAEAEELYTAVNRLQVGRCPFRTMPSVRGSVSWCRPTVVCQVRYREFTGGGKLRNPVHITIQEHYDPAECTLGMVSDQPTGS